MAWEVIIPLAASLIQGAIGSGMQANQAARENERNRLIAQMRRSELQPIIDRLREARDYFGVDEQFTRDFSRASDQAQQQAAQSGMTNAGRGGLDQVQGDLLASGLSELARFKVQDENQRQQMLAQILSDPSLYAGNLPGEDVGAQTFWGALGGGAAGLGSALNSFISTEEGLAALGGLFNGAQATQLSAPTPQVSIGAPGASMALPVPQPRVTTPVPGYPSYMQAATQLPPPNPSVGGPLSYQPSVSPYYTAR